MTEGERGRRGKGSGIPGGMLNVDRVARRVVKIWILRGVGRGNARLDDGEDIRIGWLKKFREQN